MRSTWGVLACSALVCLATACGSVQADDDDTTTADAATGAPDAPNATFSVSADTSTILIAPDQQVSVQVMITRGPGFTDAVDVALQNPPTGITASVAHVDAGATTGMLTITADASAPQSLTTTNFHAVAPSGPSADTPVTVHVRGRAGEPDVTWGQDGVLATTIPALAAAAALQSDGKIVVLGNAGGSCVVARFDPDGSPDDTFGNGGVVTYTTGSPTSCRDIIVTQDGTMVLTANLTVGAATSARLVMLGDTGAALQQEILPLGGGVTSAQATGLLQLGSGQIVVVGQQTTSGGGKVGSVWKRNQDLSGVVGFGSANGSALISFSGHTPDLRAAGVTSDGSILVGAHLTAPSGLGVARLNPGTGVVDNTFNNGAGSRAIDAPAGASFYFGDLAVLGDGRIALTGTTTVGGQQCLGFTVSAVGTSVVGPLAHALGAGVGANLCHRTFFDGGTKLVVVGQGATAGGVVGVYGWARYEATGSFALDTGFGVGGTGAASDPSSTPSELVDVLWLPDGRYLGVGSYDVGGTAKIALVRLWS
jgi:uncharacterized delta-60 repeat protein